MIFFLKRLSCFTGRALLLLLLLPSEYRQRNKTHQRWEFFFIIFFWSNIKFDKKLEMYNNGALSGVGNTDIWYSRFNHSIQIRIWYKYSVVKYHLNTTIFGLKISLEYKYKYYPFFEKQQIIWYWNIFCLNYSNII